MKQDKIFTGFESETFTIKGKSQQAEGKLQAYLLMALKEGEEVSPETVKFAPIIVSDLDLGIKEFTDLYKGLQVIGITPLATMIKQMALMEHFAESNGYDFGELMDNAMELIRQSENDENGEN